MLEITRAYIGAEWTRAGSGRSRALTREIGGDGLQGQELRPRVDEGRLQRAGEQREKQWKHTPRGQKCASCYELLASFRLAESA